MVNNKRIPNIAIMLPDLRGGGAERVCIYLANAFVARGIEVEMVLMQARGELVSLLDPRVRVVDLRAPRIRNVFGPLRRYLRQARPDALLANMWPLTVAVVLARRSTSVPARTVLVEHTSWSIDEIAQHSISRMLIHISMKAFYRSADALVAVSEGAARDLARFCGRGVDTIRVIYNPIVNGSPRSPSSVPAVPSRWVTGPHKRVLAVGTLKAIKDYPTLLRAFAALCRRVDAQLLILGEGTQRAALENLVRTLGLESRVSMPGFVRDTAPYFSHADVHVLSSTGEGFGNVIVEALEHGTPVVSTDCPSGPREILEDGKYGALVPVGDIDALANAMEKALAREHDQEKLKRRAQDFTVEKAADAYLDLLVPGWRERANP